MRRMVRVESVLISALGTITGVVLGVFTGWALIYGIDRLSEAGIAFSFPGGMLAVGARARRRPGLPGLADSCAALDAPRGAGRHQRDVIGVNR